MGSGREAYVFSYQPEKEKIKKCFYSHVTQLLKWQSIMDYCPMKEAFAAISYTGHMKRNQHNVSQCTDSVSRVRWHKKKESLWLAPLLSPVRVGGV